jgi:quercetin dioxygenase-like cupin family protein
MLTVNLNDLPLQETWVDAIPSQRAYSTLPFLGRKENENTSVVYFELRPGEELGSHTDSAEEVLFILEGRVEVIVGDEKGIVEAPALALVPTMAPHNMRNIGDVRVKIVGFFTSRYIVSTFDNQWQPFGANVIDSAQIEASLAAAN